MILKYRAMGFFLAYYERNLEHIYYFQQYINRNPGWQKYRDDRRNSFHRFLIEFRVVRNVKKGQSRRLLRLTENWINQNHPLDVNGFAKRIKRAGLSHEKQMVSLASKILFLYKPHKLLPLDSQVKASVKQKANNYEEFARKVKACREDAGYQQCLRDAGRYAEKIEERFKGKIAYLPAVRANRMLDIWLWANNGESELHEE